LQSAEYHQFTGNLKENLEKDGRVTGLIALGSMANQDYQPDEWSDHDFFVITNAGEQESLKQNLSWLPQSENIVFSFKETAHGMKVLYQSGHVLEFAVFDLAELSLAKINRYRVLLDKGGVSETAATVKQATDVPETVDSAKTFGEFIFNLLIGVSRYHRGEIISGHQFVKSYALRHLLVLLEEHLPSPQKSVLDNFDPYRRFERVYPALGKEVNALLRLDVPQCANSMLLLIDRELGVSLPSYPAHAVAVLKELL
jgi:lincosamide nucleotidyltransferase B/F